MRDQDYRCNTNLPNDRIDNLDRMIDTTLSRYATIEAREGLEQRILANLCERKSCSQSTSWVWGLAAAAVAIVIIGIAWHFDGHARPPIANDPAITKTHVEHFASPRAVDRVARNAPAIRNRAVRKHVTNDLNPKLDQFPSPRPMSEQEKLLAMYINQDPKHAALIAEARMEALRQDEAEKMRGASPED